MNSLSPLRRAWRILSSALGRLAAPPLPAAANGGVCTSAIPPASYAHAFAAAGREGLAFGMESAPASRPAEPSPEALLRLQKDYFASGATLSVKRRKRWLKQLKSAIKAHEAEIAAALKADLGKSRYESYLCETGMLLSELSFLIKHLGRYAKIRRVRTPLAQFASRSYRLPSPYGTALIMSPWNYPFLLTLEPLADALAAGNTVILKPSAYSPASGKVLKSLIGEVFPPELVSVVLGGREENGALLGLDFDKIFFTGSVGVGKEVMRRASERLIPVTLELGGKSPCIVDGTGDLKLAAKRIVFGKFLNCGQTCVAPDYILVKKSAEEELLKELRRQIALQFGQRPLENGDYGKIVNEKHFLRLCGLIAPEKVYCGGGTDRERLRIEPTVLRGVTGEDAVMREEIFGPVLPVLTYEDEEEILSRINSGPSPLAAYLFSSDRKTIAKFTSRLQFGGGCVNDVVIHLATPYMGFGGVGESGMGSYHGKDGFDCFTHYKSIVDKKTWIDLPMRYAPYRRAYERLCRLFLR